MQCWEMLSRNDWCSGCCCNAQLVVKVERGWSWHFFAHDAMKVLIAIETILGSRTCSATVWVNKRCSSSPEKRRATPEDGLPVGSGVSPTEQGLLCACDLEKENASIVQQCPASLNHSISPRTHSPAQSQTGVEPQSTSCSHRSFGKNAEAVPGS